MNRETERDKRTRRKRERKKNEEKERESGGEEKREEKTREERETNPDALVSPVDATKTHEKQENFVTPLLVL